MDGFDKARRALMAGAAGFILVPALVWAQIAPAPDADKPKAKSDTIQGGVDDSDRLTAPVMLNGKGPYAFLIDTGAERSVISADLAAELGLPVGDPIRVHGVAGEIIAPTAHLAKMDVGVRTLTNLTLPLLARHDLGADGVLGIDALQNQRVLFDFRKRQIIVEASTPRHAEPGEVVVSAKSRFGQLVLVDSSFNDEPVLVVVDTGAESSIANPALQRLITLSRRIDEKIGQADIYSVTGQKTVGDWNLTPRLKVGGVTISNLPVVFADLHSFRVWKLDRQPSMLLGMDILRQFDTVQIDFARREVRFRVPRPVTPPPLRVGS